MMNRLCSFLFLIYISQLAVIAQSYPLAEIPFKNGTEDLQLAFAGGLRAPQFNKVDLDLDGREDLLIFDREGNVLIPLVTQEDGTYRFEPQYRAVFPAIVSWMLMRDYNGDGIQDIFCAPITVGIPGVQVYRGSVVDNELRYDLVEFPTFDFDIVYYPLGSSFSQIYVSPADIPEVRDVDGDGDMDILSFDPSGSTIFWFQNMAIERNLSLESMEFKVGDQCYGDIVESGFSQEVSLSDVPGTCASFLWDAEDILGEVRHAGSTIKSYDVTGDDLDDLILGDVSYSGLVMLSNGGTPEAAWMNDQELGFPQNGDEAVDIELFVTSSVEDIDNDGEMELIAAPNSRTGAQGKNHIWVYDIIPQTEKAPRFVLQSKNYLVDEMIYTGTMSAPMFFDYNSDGLTDLLVGTRGQSPNGIDVDPRMVLFKNVGTRQSPAYQLEDNDYLGMSQYASTSRHFAPAIGDMDGDGDMDMVIGDDTGRLYYVVNASSRGDKFSFGTPIYDPWGIRVSAWAKPTIIDYNLDGLGDLVIGEQNFNAQDGTLGSLNYFENIGSPQNPDFNSDEKVSPNNPVLGGVYTKEPGFLNNYSAPAFIDLGDRILLATGTEKGNIYLYDSIRMGSTASYQLISTHLGEVREGSVGAPAFADLNGDQLLEMAIGTRRGGIAIYTTDLRIDIASSVLNANHNSHLLLVSPNPSSGIFHLEFTQIDCTPCVMQLYTADGRQLQGPRAISSPMDLDLSDYAAGSYTLQVRSGSEIYTKQLIKISH